MLQNLGVHFPCAQSFLLLSMDIDSYIEDLIDPMAKIFKEISEEDVFSILGEPAKSFRVQDRSLWKLDQRKRALSFVILDLGKKSKYYFVLIVLIT